MTPGSCTPPSDPGRDEVILRVREHVDAHWCGGECERFARSLGFEGNDLWELSIAVRELATNVVKFAGEGVVTLRRLEEPRVGIEIVAEDDGPGIEDVAAARQDGFSEGRMLVDCDRRVPRRGLGTGLGAVERMMNDMVIENRPEGGLRIVARRWLAPTRVG